jgi:hypothetical protein
LAALEMGKKRIIENMISDISKEAKYDSLRKQNHVACMTAATVSHLDKECKKKARFRGILCLNDQAIITLIRRKKSRVRMQRGSRPVSTLRVSSVDVASTCPFFFTIGRLAFFGWEGKTGTPACVPQCGREVAIFGPWLIRCDWDVVGMDAWKVDELVVLLTDGWMAGFVPFEL